MTKVIEVPGFVLPGIEDITRRDFLVGGAAGSRLRSQQDVIFDLVELGLVPIGAATDPTTPGARTASRA